MDVSTKWHRVPRQLALLRLIVAGLAAACVALAVWKLEQARNGLEITELSVGTTPATLYRLPGPPSPLVVVSHGFAGSRQLMEALSLTLARAGYLVIAFDFKGHGQNPEPMSGDVTSTDGVTAQLVAETRSIIEAGLALPYADGRAALLGHSMATDIIARTAIADWRVSTVVAVSMYSEAVTADAPRSLLMITGEWEPGLRKAALDALRQLEPDAEEGDIVTRAEDDSDAATPVVRRAVVAPGVEHVGVLYSATTLEEARAWLDTAFGRRSASNLAATGPWLLLLLASIVALAWPLAALLPQKAPEPQRIAREAFLLALAVPMGLTPLLASLVEVRFLPVLVADYMALHFLIYSGLQMLVLYLFGTRPGRVMIAPLLALVAYGLFAFGGALDAYAANFMLYEARIPVFLAIALGALPFMLADSLIVEGGHAPFWRRAVARLALLVSFGIALALDFERLFFLLLVLPVIVLFFLIYGLMGRWVGRRCGPATAGLGLGIILAWALAVTFPLLVQGGM